MLFPLLYKGIHCTFFDILFASLDDLGFPDGVFSYRKELAVRGAKFSPFRVDSQESRKFKAIIRNG